MALTRAVKDARIADLRDTFAKAQSLVVAENKGLTVAQMDVLRRRFEKAGVWFKIVKNTLAKAALKDHPLGGISADLKGPVGIAMSPEDPAAAAKILVEFAKDNEKIAIRSASLPGSRLDAEGVKTLSKMPGKDELRAMLLGTFIAPAQQLVGVLAAPSRDFVGVLDARRRQLEEQGGAGAPAEGSTPAA